MSKQLGEAAGNTKWYEMSERLIPIVKEIEEQGPQRRFLLRQHLLHDGHPARSVHADLRASPASPAGRPTSWNSTRNNRIIRPTDDYIGPFDLKVVPIDQRA